MTCVHVVLLFAYYLAQKFKLQESLPKCLCLLVMLVIYGSALFSQLSGFTAARDVTNSYDSNLVADFYTQVSSKLESLPFQLKPLYMSSFSDTGHCRAQGSCRRNCSLCQRLVDTHLFHDSVFLESSLDFLKFIQGSARKLYQFLGQTDSVRSTEISRHAVSFFVVTDIGRLKIDLKQNGI